MRKVVDLPGLVLLVAAMTLAVSALTQGRNGIDVLTVVLAVVALAALVAFVVVERRVRQPLLDPELLRGPRFRAATGGSLVLGAGMIGMASFTPALVQLGFGYGLWSATLPVLGWAGTSVVASLLVRRIPHPLEGPRPVAFFLVVVAVGQLLVHGIHPDSSLARLVLPLIVCGIGTGVLNAVLGRESIASVPPDRAAMGSGAQNTARYLGAAIGITLFVTVATHTGADLFDGFNNAALVAGGLTLLGAARDRAHRPPRGVLTFAHPVRRVACANVRDYPPGARPRSRARSPARPRCRTGRCRCPGRPTPRRGRSRPGARPGGRGRTSRRRPSRRT